MRILIEYLPFKLYNHLIGVSKKQSKEPRNATETNNGDSVNFITDECLIESVDLGGDFYNNELKVANYESSALNDSSADLNEDFELNTNSSDDPLKVPNVRLDLINEIKDEFLEDEMSSRRTGSINLFNVNEEDEDDDGELEDEEINEHMTNDQSIPSKMTNIDNLNLNDYKIYIEEIQEQTDKLNKTSCYVFVIQVWRPEHKGAFDTHADLDKPSWVVKRKYDEFYVLDSRLREFHGGLITNVDYTGKNTEQINVNLPSKRGTSLFVNPANDLEFLNSIRNELAKYLQVSKFLF